MPDSPELSNKAPPDKGASSFVYPPTEDNLDFFATVLKKGGLVAMPTETVYGLAGCALNASACRKIFEVKGRPLVDPLIVHLADFQQVSTIADIPDRLEPISKAFWPGPLTVILKKKPVVPDLVTAGKATVAIRIPRHPVARELLKRLNQPLAAPSANPFGYISPSQPQHVAQSFADKVPFIIDGGACEIGLESTILDLSEDASATILRPGAISASSIGDVLGVPVYAKQTNLDEHEVASAPGTYLRHYSPRTKLSVFTGKTVPKIAVSDAIIFVARTNTCAGENVFWLTEDGCLRTAAKSLYNLLRHVDALGYQHIYCELPESHDGFALAIRDRLARAAAK